MKKTYRKRVWWWKDVVEFAWKVMRKHKKLVERQLSEAVNINQKPSNENLNSKSEFIGQWLRMVDLERQYNCNTCGAIFSSTNEMNIHVKKFHEQVKRNECKMQCFGEVFLNI